MKHRVPPFCKRDPDTRVGKYTTPEGAHKLGIMVAEAWREQGYIVPFTVECVALHNAEYPVYAPRFPTLINGLPT